MNVLSLYSLKSKMRYLLHIPRGYTSESKKKWPMIVFLHGMSERGNNVQKLANVGVLKHICSLRDFPFFVLAPQCPLRTYWDRKKQAVNLKEIVDTIIRNFLIDDQRLYLTGYSMGGYGTWFIAAEYPKMFAAIAPICGGGDPNTMNALSHLPTWVFHGEKDSIVSIENSYRMVEALTSSGNTNVIQTYYPDYGHNCWDAAYTNEALYQWFLKYTNKHASETLSIDTSVEDNRKPPKSPEGGLAEKYNTDIFHTSPPPGDLGGGGGGGGGDGVRGETTRRCGGVSLLQPVITQEPTINRNNLLNHRGRQ